MYVSADGCFQTSKHVNDCTCKMILFVRSVSYVQTHAYFFLLILKPIKCTESPLIFLLVSFCSFKLHQTRPYSGVIRFTNRVSGLFLPGPPLDFPSIIVIVQRLFLFNLYFPFYPKHISHWLLRIHPHKNLITSYFCSPWNVLRTLFQLHTLKVSVSSAFLAFIIVHVPGPYEWHASHKTFYKCYFSVHTKLLTIKFKKNRP